MKENRNRSVLAVLMAVIITLGVVSGGAFAYLRYSGKTLVDRTAYEGMAKFQSDYSKLEKIQNAIDEKFLWEFDREEEKENIYDAMLGSLGDRYTRYLDKEALAELEATLNSSFSGTGIVIENNEKRGFIVVEIIPDSPAEHGGVMIGDVILKVDGKEYETLDEVGNAIRGEAGTSVTILFDRDGKDVEKTLIRGEIKEASVTTMSLEDGIGYIHINSFGKETFDKFDAALTGFEKSGAKGVVIDLRNNPGGLFDEGIKIADRILPECLITYTEDKNGNRVEYKSDGATTALPLAILINGNTASTSEVLAAAIKDNVNCKLVGTTTFGKGVVQETTLFGDGTAMSITTNQYFSPHGNVIHGEGIEPDIVVEPGSAGEGDVQLEAAIESLSN